MGDRIQAHLTARRTTTDERLASAIDAAVGARIRRRRTEFGLRLETLSAKVGLSTHILRKFEYGSGRLSPGRLVMIARVLDVGIAFFFDPAHWAGATDLPRLRMPKRVNHRRPRASFTAVLDRNMLEYDGPEQGIWMKVLVVDDHVLIREALSSVLAELLPNVSVLEASDYSQAIRLVEQSSNLDLITLDLALPDRDGFSVLAELRKRYPTTAVVVLSASRDPADVARAMDMGAAGYIPKTTNREVMVSAFQLIFSGGTYIPSEILASDHTASQPTDSSPLTTSLTTRLRTDVGLTGRQVEVLALIMQGKSNKAIARLLNLAEPTVKNHVTAILKALGANSRTEAVIKIGKIERGESAFTGSTRR